MQIDRIRKRLKNFERNNMEYREGAAALRTMIEVLDGATAFEVSPLLAFIFALMEKDTFDTFMDTVESSNLGMMPSPLWFEGTGIVICDHLTGRKGKFGSLLLHYGDGDGLKGLMVRHIDTEGDHVMISPEVKFLSSPLREGGAEDNLTRAVLFLTAYLRTNPIPNMKEVIAQEPRPARIRRGKEIKSPLHRIYTHKIDGVERVNGKWEVHTRGWHQRLHSVIGHWRHLEHGQTVCTCHNPPQSATWISPFIKGNPALGTTEKRYVVKPNPALWGMAAA